MPKYPLELSGDQTRQLVDLAMSHIAQHLDSLADQPAWNSDNAASVARSVPEPLPTHGEPAEEILDKFFSQYIPVTYNTASPGYLAFVPGGGLPQSAVANFIADATNRYSSLWIAGPALAQIESTVIRWFCDIVDYPAAAGGFLTSGGSLANWTAIVTARECRAIEDLARTTVYTSCQAHHSVMRAAALAGVPKSNVRKVDVDERFRLRIDRLAERISEDRANGLTPLAIVAHAGTTNTGAVDDLGAIADFSSSENIWLHVDAAYGGFFMLTERGRTLMEGIERADSITLDPHKGLFLPYGTGCLLVRNLETLYRAHHISADYLPAMQEQREFVDICDISPELSRDFRGLRVWLPIKMHGIEPFRQNLDEKLDLARWATQQLRTINDEILDDLEIIAEPELSLVAFRLRREGLDEQALTRLNEDLRDRINASRRVFLTPTMLDDRYVIRICVLSFRTHMDRMEECLDLIRQAIVEICKGYQ